MVQLEMASGIDKSMLVVVLVTAMYVNKVGPPQ